MLKSLVKGFLVGMVLMAALAGCGKSKKPAPDVPLKRDGSEVVLTQIATKAKTTGGTTVDAYEIVIGAAKSSTLLLLVDGGVIDTKDPNAWLFDGQQAFFDPYAMLNCVIVFKKGMQMGRSIPNIKPADAKAKCTVGGVIDLPVETVLKP